MTSHGGVQASLARVCVLQFAGFGETLHKGQLGVGAGSGEGPFLDGWR
jgi:hypothetical protein